jgi:RimJ/RimL family protein N-acetyltransferase
VTEHVGRTARLVISRMAPDDAAGLHSALAGPDVGRYLGGPDVGDLDDVRRRIARVLAGPDDPDRTWVNLTLREVEGPVIGRLEATVNPGWAEVAWVLGAAWWGRGYGTESALWLADYLADVFGVTELWGTVHPDNTASIALMRRLGMSEQAGPFARELGSWDPGDLVFARRPSE